MNKNIRTISICIGITALLILSASPMLLASTHATNDKEKREYTGPKVVFDDKNYIGNDANSDTKAVGNKGKPPQPPQVDKWAVVIGISDYQGIGSDLRYPDDDAIDMYNYLIAKGYPSGNINLLLNTKASARNILKAIDWMNSKEAKTTSECVFFYSGHGSTYDGYNDGDTEYTDEGIVSTDLYLILDGQLRTKFSTFTSQKIAFIFDSCFSGGMDDLIGAYTPTTYSGRVVETAASETQLSWDGDEVMQNGVFTYYYMQGLNAQNTIEDAHAYASPLAHDAVLAMYGEHMDPQLYDAYSGQWQF